MSLIENHWGMLRCENSYSLTYHKDNYINDMCETMFYMFICLGNDESRNIEEQCINALVFIYGERLSEVWEERHDYMTRLLL
jgi:hypothetical protein